MGKIFELDMSGITDTNLMNTALNIQKQADAAKTTYDNTMKTLADQMLALKQKQAQLEAQKKSNNQDSQNDNQKDTTSNSNDSSNTVNESDDNKKFIKKNNYQIEDTDKPINKFSFVDDKGKKSVYSIKKSDDIFVVELDKGDKNNIVYEMYNNTYGESVNEIIGVISNIDSNKVNDLIFYVL